MNRKPSWLMYLEPLAVAIAAPALLFPTLRPALTIAALCLLIVAWIIRWRTTRRPGSPSPIDMPLLLFIMMLPVAVCLSPSQEITVAKFTGLIFGIAVFRATVNTARSPEALSVTALFFLSLGLLLSAVGLLGTNWEAKWSLLWPLLQRLPKPLAELPGTAAEGISANQLAGGVLMFLPVAVAALGSRIGDRRGLQIACQVIAGILAICFTAVLVLSQSRSGWIGALAGLLLMLWLGVPRMRPTMAIGTWAAGTALALYGPRLVVQTYFGQANHIDTGPLVSPANMEARIEIWVRAIETIKAFPLSGCGLGAFRSVVDWLGPLVSFPPGYDIAHAHNMLMQAALDVGLPGLVAYIAMVETALWICIRVALSPDSQLRWLGLGLAGSLAGLHIYGLADVVALGSKPGLAFWMVLGLAAGLWCHQRSSECPAAIVD